MLCALAGCASIDTKPTPFPPPLEPRHHEYQAYIINTGWHTGYILPSTAVLPALPELKPWFGGTRYLIIGWGNRSYYMARNPGIGKMLGAVFPSRSVICIQGIHRRKFRQVLLPSVHTYPIEMTRPEVIRLDAYIARYLAKGSHGLRRPAKAPFWPDSWFFRSTGVYDLFHNCNTWTLGGLKDAGLPVHPSGALLAEQVISQIRRLNR